MPSRDNNSRKCFTKAWRHGLWASTCHLFQFFEWFYQFIAWNDNDNKTNTKPIEPGTNDCDCRYETIILIIVSAYNQSQATATDSLNDKINLNFNCMTFFDLFHLTIVGFCFAKWRNESPLDGLQVNIIHFVSCVQRNIMRGNQFERIFFFSNYLVYNFMSHKILKWILIFRFCFDSIAGCWLFISQFLSEKEKIGLIS